MPEVKADGSSAQDAGKATQPDLNAMNSKEQSSATDTQPKEVADSSDDTSKEVETVETEQPDKGEAVETEETSEEGTNDDGKAEYLRQKQEANAARKIQETTAKLQEAEKRLKAFEDTQERLVRNDVNYLYTVAQSDRKLADKLVTKIFGQTHGIETLDELRLVADRSQADEKYKPLYDQQLAMLKKLRELEEYKDSNQAADTQKAMKEFKALHPDFSGSLKDKTLEIQERSNGAFALDEAYKMAKAFVGSSAAEQDAEKAAVKQAQNTAGTRGGGETKAGMAKGKPLTESQLKMAQRFKHDPVKVYSS